MVGAAGSCKKHRIHTIPAVKFIKTYFCAVLKNNALKMTVIIKVRKNNCTFIKYFYFRTSSVRRAYRRKVERFRLGSGKNIQKRFQRTHEIA